MIVLYHSVVVVRSEQNNDFFPKYMTTVMFVLAVILPVMGWLICTALMGVRGTYDKHPGIRLHRLLLPRRNLRANILCQIMFATSFVTDESKKSLKRDFLYWYFSGIIEQKVFVYL